MEELILRLSKYGSVQVCKESSVFTILITAEPVSGKPLTNANTNIEIQKIILDYAAEEYPLIDVLKNDELFYFCQLKPMNKNCLQRALKQWEESGKDGKIVYDVGHAQFFSIAPMDLSEYGLEYFKGAFGPKCDSPLTQHEIDLLSQYIEKEKQKQNEPYFGWCDVKGCDRESASGGGAWPESGYWHVCHDHSLSFRLGNPQPEMKKSATLRESNRGEDGILKPENEWNDTK